MKESRLYRWSSISIIALLLLIKNNAFAASLMPIGVNDLYIYDKHDSVNSWAVYLWGIETVDMGGIEYINIAMLNEDGTGSYEEELGRSTENAMYFENGNIGFQIAPIGTTWSYPSY